MSIDLDALIDQAFSGDDAMADALLNHLRASPDAALFLKLLGSERASLRHAALQYLEHCPHPDVLLAAAKLVNDPEEEVREALAEALQKLSAWQAGDLVERLLTDQAPGVRREIGRASCRERV